MMPPIRKMVVFSAVLAMALICAFALAQQGSFWTAPPLKKEIKKPAAKSALPKPAPQPETVISKTMKFTTPRPGAIARGVLSVNVAGLNRDGYIVFRIDNQFAYATIYPYKMRWDTQGAADGEHVIQASGFTAGKKSVGSINLKIRVQNRITNAIPPQGIKLAMKFLEGGTIQRTVEGVAEVVGLGPELKLPSNLIGLQGRLYAKFRQSVVNINPLDRSALVRTTVRQGTLSAGDIEIEIAETDHYGITNLLPNGLELTPTAQSRRPSIGLGEISLALPSGPIREGMSWTSAMRVVPDLVQRNSIEVEGRHTFEGLWWMMGRKCARISSLYEIGEVALTDQATQQLSQARPGETYSLQLTQGRRGGGMRGGGSRGRGGGQTLGQTSLRGGRTNTSSRAGQPTTGQPATATPTAPAPPSILARLTGLTGSRTTWIDIERGIVVQVQDQINGTLVLATAATENAPSTSTGEEEAITTSSLPQPAAQNYEFQLTQRGGSRGGGSRGGAQGWGGSGTSSGYGSTGRGQQSYGGFGGLGARSIRRSLWQSPSESEMELPNTQRLPYSLSLTIEIVG